MITVEGLTKVYRQNAREVRALDDVNLQVPTGSIHGIIGRSGAGKSTLVRCLTLLDHPTEGTVAVNDTVLSNSSAKQLRQARRRIGVVFQNANLLSSRTVVDNVALPLEISSVSNSERKRRAAELVNLVGLDGFREAYPAQLSGGQRQRVGIARALAADPDVLLCDEPTSALDPATTKEILELIRSVAHRLNLTVVVITHEMHVVKTLCDAVSLLDAGRIVESGPLEEVAAHLNGQLSAALLPLDELDEAHRDPQATLIEVLGSGEHLPAPTTVLEEALPVKAIVSTGTIEYLGPTRFAHQLLSVTGGDQPPAAEPALQVLRAAGFQARALKAGDL
ncbi:methionine ABC transporter ATP-binding protein [Auritidibacter ignavus]|uniref:methionine ABC transporter ATP-binding protein n=1 Tax=Auritidibacter ignavus TaxID=678932 RepID=UPI0024495195|nr:methionine ABC transporter ATP-binding protein [Auritidibacter ignavus]WGH89974.1 methionine ABC transporter ATP-binding protein [Auritidibacter ignavus]